MMIRLLLLILCLMHLKEVAGTITLTTDSSLVETGAAVALTCKDTEEVDIEIYFAGQRIGGCSLFGGNCPVSEQTLYSVSIDESPTGYNLMTFTIKSFAANNCGEYTCLKKSDASVNDTTTVEHKLSYGTSCGTCGQCFPSTLMECSSTCKCNAGYTFDGSDCVCDCCCCDNKPKRDGACGAVLGVCICVMAVLVICFYKGFSSNHLQGKIFKLILAIFCLIVALTGLILSAICLSKECCSCSGDSCQAKNCFKGDTIAGFVMTGLSVLGTVIVIILIFLITGESGNRRDPERPSRGNTRGAGVSVPNNPPNDTHSAGSLVSRADIYPSLESDRTSNAPLRAQPLPPVGAQGHGRGLSANYRDGMDDMPVVGGQKKSLPPIEGNSGEDAEVRKRKKKKKKTKGNDDMELSNRGDKSD